MGDVVALPTVSSRQRLDESPLFISQGDGDSVDFILDGVIDRFDIQQFSDSLIELSNTAFAVDVVDRQHRQAMRNGAKPFNWLAADFVGWAVGRIEFGVLGFELFEPLQQTIKVKIADLRSRIDVIQAAVPVDFASETFDFFVRREHGEAAVRNEVKGSPRQPRATADRSQIRKRNYPPLRGSFRRAIIARQAVGDSGVQENPARDWFALTDFRRPTRRVCGNEPNGQLTLTARRDTRSAYALKLCRYGGSMTTAVPLALTIIMPPCGPTTS